MFAREFLNNPAFLTLIGDLRGRQVLDAGCGDGYNTRILARAGAHMTGVDLSARMIGLAQEAERRTRWGFATLARRIPTSPCSPARASTRWCPSWP